MVQLFQQVLSLLTTTPGSLTYHLVVAFSIAGALQAALNAWRSQGVSQARRLTLGLSLLLAIRLVLFVAAAFTWQGILPEGMLPPIDRSVALISLIIITWMWVFPTPVRLVDTANLLLGLLVGVYLVLALLWFQSSAAGMPFTGSGPDIAALGFALLLIALNLLVLLVRRPNGWGVGLGMLLLLFAGHLAHLIAPLAGTDLPVVIRLAEIAAFPLLFYLPQRLPPSVETIPSQEALPAVTQSPDNSAPQLAQDLMALAVESDFNKVCSGMTQIVAQLMTADLCLILSAPEQSDQLLLHCGYNRVKQESIGGFPLAGRLVPTISNALRRNRPLRLPASTTSSDLIGLAHTLETTRTGDLMAVPIQFSNSSEAFGIVVLSPYSDRRWSPEEQSYLTSLATTLSNILQKSHQSSELQQALDQAQAEVQQAQAKIHQIQQENEKLLIQLETARQASRQEHSRAESLAALVASQEGSNETITRLEAEIRRLKEQAASQPLAGKANLEAEHLETELRLALEEIAHLKTDLSESDQKILELEARPSASPTTDEQISVVASISQELRQPMSSIVGYTDLLLGESVGILGALQRKFLERIKASVERMGALVDDMIQVTIAENSEHEFAHEPIDLNSVIDESVALTISQLREKNIVMRVDLSDQLPTIRADRDALQQVLIHLLQNAGSATPEEGEISLHARVREDERDQDYVLLQVSDSGGGISPEDLPRVFSRLYRSDNSAIPGLGETGIGLTVVKSLVESHGGRIWVDTEMGRGSTFSVLLPIQNSVLAARRGTES